MTYMHGLTSGTLANDIDIYLLGRYFTCNMSTALLHLPIDLKKESTH